ncbi:MAG: APC family permease [Fimbriimonadales bacterium]
MAEAGTERLDRGIRRWDLVALVLNAVIGAGIFGLPAKAFALVGSYSVFAYVGCALLVILVVLCFAELSSRVSATGGPYLYAREAFGPFVGFLVGWLMWLTRLTAFAALCNLFVGYLGHFWPPAETGLARGLIITALVGAVAFINIIGVRKAALVSNVFVIGKLSALLMFILVGLFFVRAENISFTGVPDANSFSAAVLLLVFSFGGFEGTPVVAGEAREPTRQMPFALICGVGIAAAVYVLIQFVCIGTLPGLASSERPLADAANSFVGVMGASVISAGALISVTGTLNSIMLGGPRILYALAEGGQLPRAFTLTHARFRTPFVAILVSAIGVWALSVWGSFLSGVSFSTISRLLTYAATCVAVIVLRQRSRDRAPFSVPGGIAVAVAGFGLCVWLVVSSGTTELMAGSIAAGAGLLVYSAHWSFARLRA